MVSNQKMVQVYRRMASTSLWVGVVFVSAGFVMFTLGFVAVAGGNLWFLVPTLVGIAAVLMGLHLFTDVAFWRNVERRYREDYEND